MMPEKRLEHRVDETLTAEREACILHNSIETCTERRCGRDQKIPTKTLQVLSGHEDAVWCLEFSHDGKYLASGSGDRTVIIWEVVRDDYVRVKYTLKGLGGLIFFLAWSPDDTMLLTCCQEEVEGEVHVWDVHAGECTRIFGSKGGCAWFPDGKRFVTSGADRRIHVWDLEGKEIDVWGEPCSDRAYHLRAYHHCLAITPDGAHVLRTYRGNGIRMYNVELQTDTVILEEAAEALTKTFLSLSADGRHLLVRLDNNEIHVWDVIEHDKTSKLITNRGYFFADDGSCWFGGSDETLILSGSGDCHVYIWQRDTGELVDALPGHEAPVSCVCWNAAHPHMFASGSSDHTIRVWGLNK